MNVMLPTFRHARFDLERTSRTGGSNEDVTVLMLLVDTVILVLALVELGDDLMKFRVHPGIPIVMA